MGYEGREKEEEKDTNKIIQTEDKVKFREVEYKDERERRSDQNKKAEGSNK